MPEYENHLESEKKRLEVKDWVIIGLGGLVLLLLVGLFKGNASNFKLSTENKRLKNDIQYISVLATTLVDMKDKEVDLNKWDCSGKLNQGYLNLYEKLNIKSESTMFFKSKLDEAVIEKAGLIDQRNEKAASYNTYANSLNWDEYESQLYNLPREIPMID